MLSEGKVLRCNKNVAHRFFIASAHTVEEWEVDELGGFSEYRSTLETTHEPGDDEEYQCCECLSEAKIVTLSDIRECANCARNWNLDELKPIQDPWQRIAEGEPWPAGECPDCGSLCYKVEKEGKN